MLKKRYLGSLAIEPVACYYRLYFNGSIMAYLKERERALLLRKQGHSYSQIKLALGVSKGTLSYWLKDHPLSKKRIEELRDNHGKRIEKYRETRKRQREQRLSLIYRKQESKILPLNEKNLFLAGLFLYWGEGAKRKAATLSLSNSNPAVVRFFIEWCERCLGVSRSKFLVYLHLYSDMTIAKELQYWSKVLSIPKSQFRKPYVKVSEQQRINHKGAYSHGTCNVSMGDARLTEQILQSIRVIEDTYTRL